MFDSIKKALNKSTSQNDRYKDILKLQPDNIYTVRLVPNLQDPEKTFFHYFTHAWESFSTGRFISCISPQTWGERDPIAETKYTLMKHGTDEEKNKAEKILRRENWLVNVYVINDPTVPENNGKVKILRFGRQLHKIIMEAIEGDDAEDFGSRVFDLSPEGCSFKIKVERQGEYPTYVSSRFETPKKVKGLSEDGVADVYDNSTDLETVFPVRSGDELKQTLDEHFFGNSSGDRVWDSEDNSSSSSKPAESKGDTLDLDSVDPLDDDKVKELLDGLGD